MDFDCYNALLNAGYEVLVVGPLDRPTSLLERVEIKLWQVYKRITKKSGIKYPLSTALKASNMMIQEIRRNAPDGVFSIFPSFFVFRNIPVVSLWHMDSSFLGQEESWPTYGSLALKVTVWLEKRAMSHVSKIVTTSHWSKHVLKTKYEQAERKIEVVPLPSSLPNAAIPVSHDVEVKVLEYPILLLLVGRVFFRKGIDIAIDVVEQLNRSGLPSELIVCGINEQQIESVHVKFVGPYKKSDPDQLKQYVDLYKNAHLLNHPARSEAPGMVPSEAAAFGTPTITNDVGGLATSVKDGVSGIVLPKGSPASAYVSAIIELVNDPERYHLLCRTTRERYEKELNWDVVGKQLVAILENAVSEHRTHSGEHD